MILQMDVNHQKSNSGDQAPPSWVEMYQWKKNSPRENFFFENICLEFGPNDAQIKLAVG